MNNTSLIQVIEGFGRCLDVAHVIWLNGAGLPTDHNKLLDSPINALRFFAAYAHERGGTNRRFALYHRVAIDKAVSYCGENILSGEFAETTWNEFRKLAIKPNEKNTKGPVKDILTELSKAGELNIIRHLRSLSLQGAYQWLTNIKGIKQKVASLLLRDIWSYVGHWPETPPSSLKYLQPIDRWVRMWVEEFLWPRLDWSDDNLEFAAQVVELCQKSGINDVELNKGAWFVGSHFDRLCQFFGLPENEWVDFANATKFDCIKVEQVIRNFKYSQYPFVL
jgi:hypothetical protein